MSTKDDIISAASDLFSEKGLDLSVAEIANQVGIKTPSLYSHFNSKEEIVSIAIEQELSRFYQYLNFMIDSLAGKTVEETLKRLMVDILVYFDTPGKLKIWKRIPLIDNREIQERYRGLLQEGDNIIIEKLRRKMNHPEFTGAVDKKGNQNALMSFFILVQGLLDLKLFLGLSSTEIEQYAVPLWDVFWKGTRN